MTDSIFDDLAVEEQRIEAILGALTDEQWRSPSAADGWSVSDVVLHLAQSEELAAATLTGAVDTGNPLAAGTGMDDAMAAMVASQRAEPEEIFERWRTARRRALEAMGNADPVKAVPWAAAPLRPATLATTRLAEHWAHALDVTAPLQIAYDDSDRLRHVAWLAHRTLPYAWALAGAPAHELCCVLEGPTGTTWRFGPAEAESTVEGPLGDFCRVAAQRRAPAHSRLRTSGPHAADALAVVRTYAA